MKKITLMVAAFLLAMTATFAQVAYEQESNDPDGNGIVSDYYEQASGGAYAADDFELSSEMVVDSLKVYGFSQSGTLVEDGDLTEVSFYIYTDADGEPSGDPSVDGSEEMGVTLSVNDPALHITVTSGEEGFADSYDFSVDVTAALGDEFTLDPGVYWIVAYPTLTVDPSSQTAPRWNWLASLDTYGNDPMLTDPEELFGVGQVWTPLNDLTGGGFNALAFTIYGPNMGVADYDATTFSHFVNNNQLYLNSDSQIEDVAIFNLLGQEVSTSSINSTNGQADLSGLSSGVYIAKVAVNGQTKTFKFVK